MSLEPRIGIVLHPVERGPEFGSLLDSFRLSQQVEGGRTDIRIRILQAGQHGFEHDGLGQKIGRTVGRLLAEKVALIL